MGKMKFIFFFIKILEIRICERDGKLKFLLEIPEKQINFISSAPTSESMIEITAKHQNQWSDS